MAKPKGYASQVKTHNALLELMADFGGKFPKEVKAEIRPLLRASGKAALTDAKANASWSTQIPAATRLQIGLAGKRPGVAIVVNKNKAPHGRPLEHGGRPGRVRHPLFGNRKKWVSQPAQVFLSPVAPPWQAEVLKGIGDAIDQVARRHGFR